jgi:hypothetical protein
MATGKEADDLFGVIRNLPVADRLKLVERVVHDIAEPEGSEPKAQPMSVIGAFSDLPDLIQEVCQAAMGARGRDPLRLPR